MTSLVSLLFSVILTFPCTCNIESTQQYANHTTANSPSHYYITSCSTVINTPHFSVYIVRFSDMFVMITGLTQSGLSVQLRVLHLFRTFRTIWCSVFIYYMFIELCVGEIKGKSAL